MTDKQRKAPLVPAKSLPVGTHRKGVDGSFWKVATTKTGVARWVRVKKAQKAPTSAMTSFTYIGRNDGLERRIVPTEKATPDDINKIKDSVHVLRHTGRRLPWNISTEAVMRLAQLQHNGKIVIETVGKR